MSSKKVLILYYSGSGNTKKMAKADSGSHEFWKKTSIGIIRNYRLPFERAYQRTKLKNHSFRKEEVERGLRNSPINGASCFA